MPVLYSFRRCPYAMRARLAVWESGLRCELREVVLRDKPSHMLEISPKGTVPVLWLDDGTVIDESLDVMRLALGSEHRWLYNLEADLVLIAENDGPFKQSLDRYKYGTRYPEANPEEHRARGLLFLQTLESKLDNGWLSGNEQGLADVAIAPFVRQFANTDRKWFDALDLPKLQAWLGRFLDSAEFAAIMSKYGQWHEGDEPVWVP